MEEFNGDTIANYSKLYNSCGTMFTAGGENLTMHGLKAHETKTSLRAREREIGR